LLLIKYRGDWDEVKLASLMAEFDASTFDVSLTGFDADEVDALLNKFYSKEAIQDDFDVDKERKPLKLLAKHELIQEISGCLDSIGFCAVIAQARRILTA